MLVVVVLGILINPIYGIVISVAIGLFKEYIWDKWLGNGCFDINDMKANSYGILLGIIILCLI